MKKLIIFLLIAAAAKYGWDRYQLALEKAKAPDVFTNPVYAVVRFKLQFQGRSFDEVVFAQTRDPVDCQSYSKMIINQAERPDQKGLSWTLQSSECKTELEPRYAKLFDNQPTSVTYLSLGRGGRDERETRVIYWNITVEESDRACSGVSQMQAGHGRKGAVRCIHAQKQ